MKNLFLLVLMFMSTFVIAQIEKEVISSIPFRNIGPAFMSGRISDIAKDPKNPSTWYVSTASGNAWKTTNNGTTWKPIFDDYGTYSIGCVAVDPIHSNVVWLGTGENQSQRSVGWGDGIYKSLDGGKSWKNVGLKHSEHIGKILIDPRDPNVVYVASQGPLWKEGGERGVYKTIDGGKSWNHELSISDQTGVSDLAFDPKNPDLIYAASYQRRRHVGILVAGGEESRIYKSADAGITWTKLTNGLPSGDVGRIAIAVSPQQTNVVYALIAAAENRSGFFRSEDYGESWKKMNDYIVVDPQYYGEIYCDPHRFDCVYAMDVVIHYTENGGEDFERLNTRFKHVDNHAMLFDQDDPDYMLIGCDGGLYESWDRGDSWSYHSNLPITQFYRVGIDNDLPFYNVYGGTQDNSTLYGPSQTASRHGITNADWKIALGGDGFQARIDPDDPNTVYCQYQYAGIVRYNRKTGQRIDIQPQPAPDDAPLRWHWDSPLLISHHDSKTIYFAAQRIFKSVDRGDTWTAISPDLSRNEDRNQREVMGKIWSPEAVWKNVFTSPYGTIVSMSESALDKNLIVAGTDDGLIQITEDGGSTWRKIESFGGVPGKAYLADLFTSQHNRNVIYTVFNNHKEGDFNPYIAKSENLGKSWTSITNGIDYPNACWSIYEDHLNPNLLFAATEFGLYCSMNGGQKWIQFKNGLPTMAFRDLEIHQGENDLVAASFGRGFFILDDYSAVRALAESTVQGDHIFPISNARQYPISGHWGYSEKGAFGDNFYTAKNPPYGAAFDIYLSQSFQTSKQKRKEKEKSKSFYPNFSELEMEDKEEKPQIYVRITDDSGNGIQTIGLKNKQGYQRVHWNLATSVSSSDLEYNRRGPEVNPGSYHAQVWMLQNGEEKALTENQMFQVKRLSLSDEIPANDRFSIYEESTRLLLEARSLVNTIKDKLEHIENQKQVAMRNGKNSNLPQLEATRRALLDLNTMLLGNESRKDRFEYDLPGIISRLNRVSGNQYQTDQVTNTHRESMNIARTLLNECQNLYQSLNLE